MLADYHIHTSFSNDSEVKMEDYVRRAIQMKFDEICFTEHIDYGVPEDICDCRKYHEEYLRCKELYRNQISLKFGIEFGVQTHTIKEYEKTFSEYPFDFILLSCHQADDREFHKLNLFSGMNQDQYNRCYYEELLNVAKNYTDYSVMAHLDMIRRYDPWGDYPFEKVKSIITEILKTAIAEGKGIEINTSSFKYHLKDLTPSRDILRLYHNLGGRILTFGSDSHQLERLGSMIPEMQKEAVSLGFTEFCTFEKMEPVFHKLTVN